MKSLYKNRSESEYAPAIRQYGTYAEFRLDSGGEEEPAEEQKTEAETQFEESLSQAEKIIDAARQEAETIRKNAHEEGFAKGENEGYDEGYRRAALENQQRYDEQVKELQDKIGSYIADVEIEKEKVLEQYLDDLKGIALTIGEKIVQISLKSSGDVVERMILSATERLKKCAWAKIYIGQNGEKTDVYGDNQFLTELSKLSDNVKIVLMEDTEAGTCIVELPDEVIDISVGTQLENIKEILNNARV